MFCFYVFCDELTVVFCCCFVFCAEWNWCLCFDFEGSVLSAKAVFPWSSFGAVRYGRSEGWVPGIGFRCGGGVDRGEGDGWPVPEGSLWGGTGKEWGYGSVREGLWVGPCCERVSVRFRHGGVGRALFPPPCFWFYSGCWGERGVVGRARVLKKIRKWSCLGGVGKPHHA